MYLCECFYYFFFRSIPFFFNITFISSLLPEQNTQLEETKSNYVNNFILYYIHITYKWDRKRYFIVKLTGKFTISLLNLLCWSVCSCFRSFIICSWFRVTVLFLRLTDLSPENWSNYILLYINITFFMIKYCFSCMHERIQFYGSFYVFWLLCVIGRFFVILSYSLCNILLLRLVFDKFLLQL